MKPFALMSLVLCGLAAVPAARAAESLDACGGRYVESLPTVISSPGVWCLRKDLVTAMTSGNAITIGTNNVTLDCNGYRIGGLAGGDGSTARGLRADSRQNVTVRNCNFRGFYIGAQMSGSGHLVEDNRFDDMLATGLGVFGESNLVRRNQVTDTGGWTGGGSAAGIQANADVIDNIVSNVFATSGDATGIWQAGDMTRVRGNTVRGLHAGALYSAYGIDVIGVEVAIEDNLVASQADVAGVGVAGYTGSMCSDNKVVNFATAFTGCIDGGHNLFH